MATRRMRPDDGDPDEGDAAGPAGGPDWRRTVAIAADPVQTEEDELVARVRASVAEVGTDRVRVKVYRSTGGAVEWIDDLQFEEWAEGGPKLLRDRFGPGRYNLRIYGPNGLIARPDLRIADLPKPPTAPTTPAVPDSLTRALEALAANQAQMLAALTAPKPDPMARLFENADKIAAVVGMFRQFMTPPPAPPAPPAVDPTAMLTQIVGAVRQLREVAQEVSPPAEDPDNPMSMLPKILDTVQALSGRGASQPVAPLALPDSMQDEPEANEGGFELMYLRGKLLQLLALASQGASAERGAEFVIEHLPGPLRDALADPQWLSMLQAFEPKCASHAQWLTDVRAAVLSSTPNPG